MANTLETARNGAFCENVVNGLLYFRKNASIQQDYTRTFIFAVHEMCWNKSKTNAIIYFTVFTEPSSCCEKGSDGGNLVMFVERIESNELKERKSKKNNTKNNEIDTTTIHL